MRRIMLLLFALLLAFPLSCAVRFELNATYDLRTGLHPNGVFVDGDRIYIWYYDDRTVYEHYIEPSTGKLRTSKEFGLASQEAEERMSNIVDVWADGNYVYVLDKGGRVFKFDKTTGELKFRGDSESYRPRFPAAIAASGNSIYILDRDMGQVNVLEQYSKDKYVFKSSISWGYLGIGDAIFKSPEDLFIDENGTIYVVDTYNNRIALFTDNNTYVRSIGRGSGGSTLSRPHTMALDNDYLYVVEDDRISISVFLRSDDRPVQSIGNSTFEFRRISGIFQSGNLLYVVDYNKDVLIVLYMNKSSLLEKDDVVPLYANVAEDVQRVCTLFSVAADMGINVTGKCAAYTKALAEASAQLSSGEYDLAYSALVRMKPQLEGETSYLSPLVAAELSIRSATLRNETLDLLHNLTGQLNRSATKILMQLKSVDNYIASGDYLSASILLKELEVRYNSLFRSQGTQQDAENMRIENYVSQLNSIQATYDTLWPELMLYRISYDADHIEYLLGTARDDIENYALDAAYSKITELVLVIDDLQLALNAKKQVFSEAQQRIASANSSLLELKNSTQVLQANTSLAEGLLANATLVIYEDPALAMQYAEQAAAEIARLKKDAEDANFLTMYTAAVIVFLAVIVAILIFSIKRLLRKRGLLGR